MTTNLPTKPTMEVDEALQEQDVIEVHLAEIFF
jgi:hypothetical protein